MENGNRKYITFLSEKFNYLTTGSARIKCVHLNFERDTVQVDSSSKKKKGKKPPVIPQKELFHIAAL